MKFLMSVEKLFVCIFVFSCYVWLHRISNLICSIYHMGCYSCYWLSHWWMFVYIATYLAIVRHIPSRLYIINHWVSVHSNLSSWSKQYILAVHYIPWHDICRTLHPDKNPMNHILSQMFYTQPRKYQQLWRRNKKGSLLQCVVTATISTCTC